MGTIALSDILDDIKCAEEGLHKFERRYWISSEDFFQFYSQGLLDDGENSEDFSEWAGHFKLREKRMTALSRISEERLASLRTESDAHAIRLMPAEPILKTG